MISGLTIQYLTVLLFCCRCFAVLSVICAFLQVEQRRVQKAANARAQVTMTSITVANKTMDIEKAVYNRFCAWMRTQVAGAAALERGGTYGHLHIQAVAKVYAATPQETNRLLKVPLLSACSHMSIHSQAACIVLCIQLLLKHMMQF